MHFIFIVIPLLSQTFWNILNFNTTLTILNIIFNINKDTIANGFLLECFISFCLIIGFSITHLWHIKDSPILYTLHNMPRFTPMTNMKLQQKYYCDNPISIILQSIILTNMKQLSITTNILFQ